MKRFLKPVCLALLLALVLVALAACGEKGPLQGTYKSASPLQAVLKFSGKDKVEVLSAFGTGKGTYRIEGGTIQLKYRLLERDVTMDGTCEKLSDSAYHLYLNDADFYPEGFSDFPQVKNATETAPAASASPFTRADFFRYVVNLDGNAEITGYTGNEAAVLIPDAIDGHKVVAIQNGALRNNRVIGRLVLPEGCESVGDSAFENCVNLREVSLPESLTCVGEYAFVGTTALRELALPDGAYTVRYGAFAKSGLVSVSISKGAQHRMISQGNYESGWFVGCYSLRTVVYEDGCTQVMLGDFRGDVVDNGVVRIDSVTIPASVTEIYHTSESAPIYTGLFNCSVKKVVVDDGSYAQCFFADASKNSYFTDRRDFSTPDWADTYRPYDGEIALRGK